MLFRLYRTSRARIRREPTWQPRPRPLSASQRPVALDTAAPPIPVEEIQYTITDTDGDSSSASLRLTIHTNHMAGTDAANHTITATNANDNIAGLAGNDVLNGGTGGDLFVLFAR